ncbi:MAG: hypothetical protein JWM34_2069 [Ilumatobacteraceae bacterium]|nr:hypothetical protein [Ilumatobacteraceae bacterium]
MVPVVDLSRRGHLLAAQFASTVAGIVQSGVRLLGHETSAFEQEFGGWLGALAAVPAAPSPDTALPLEVVAVSSGASALQLALAALGVGPGDEVIVPAFTAVPTAAAVCAVGARPVPVDVLADTANLDPDAVEAARTDRTRAVIVVHLYGRPAELPVTDLPIIEDAAQAHGAIFDHSRSAVTAYSFYPTKNLGGIGDGGAVVTTDPALAEHVRRLRAHGMTELYVHTEISQNFRMSEIEAAWLRLNLPQLRDDNARRHAIGVHYRAAAPALRWHLDDPLHVHHLCVLRTTDRVRTRAAMAEAGVATAIHYPLAITQQPAYAQFTVEACPEAEAWAAECVSVPCFPEMTDDEVAQVADALTSVPT